MEHCGDDFLAALAESMQDTEDWDDLQQVETEACGALNDIFEKEVVDREYIDIVDSPEPKTKKQPTYMELDSSSDGEDLDFTTPKPKSGRKNPCFRDGDIRSFTQSSGKQCAKSGVSIL